MEKKTAVLFVCLGNICRSPVAEGVFSRLVSEKGLSHLFEIDSAATSANHIGESPDPRTLRNSTRNNLHLTHKARQLQVSDFHRFDYILAMDKNNLRDILKVAPPEYSAQVALFASFDPDPRFEEVPDPYFGSEPDFQRVYELCEQAANHFLQTIQNP